jgi:hypothetical protein
MQAVINQLATRQKPDNSQQNHRTSRYTFIKEQAVFLPRRLLNPSCSFSH